MTDPGLAAEVERVSRAFARAARSYRSVVQVRDEGRVLSVADGVATVAGLSRAAVEEVLLIGSQHRALALGLERDHVHAALLDDPDLVRRGARVRGSGGPASVLASPELFGRVVDPLGRPLDGRPRSAHGEWMPLERPAPQIHERDAVHRPLHTGVLAVDAMLPIGRGQRELLLGDEGTGKTSLALDALLFQARTGGVGVYVAVGRRRAEVRRVVDQLASFGERWVVVSAPADRPPGLRYLAPYAGCAVAEYFMERGEHALIVYDDLTAHAVAWRELSLLMRRPPGREAYPGDVFHLHARLLERAAQLSAERGGGSLTALPIANLENGRISAYLPTNLISITDGQIVLTSPLFAAGQRPAIDASLSISRVGSRAQPQALRELSSKLRLEHAAFLELEAFSRVGARLEESVARRLARGQRVRRLLRQTPGAPLDLFETVVRLAFADRPASFDRVDVERVLSVAGRVAGEARSREPVLAERIESEGVLTRDDRARLDATIDAVVEGLLGREPAAGEESAQVGIEPRGAEEGGRGG